jgi:NAD(P)-dependent dehydrogenase (short-subunit alcohol dehydrogenase family)
MIVLITGSSSGLGKEISQTYLNRSHYVIGVSRTCPDFSSKNYYHIHADLSSPSECQRIVDHLNDKSLIPSRFIHCAGFNETTSFTEFNSELVNNIFNVNFFSCLYLTQALLRSHNDLGCRFIAISSIWSFLGASKRSIYGASKGALDSLYKHLAAEYIDTSHRFMTVQLGFTESPLMSKTQGDPILNPFFKKYINHKPLNAEVVCKTIVNALESPLFPQTVSMKIDCGLS